MIEQKKIKYKKVVLIGIKTQKQTEEEVHDYLDELKFLAYTAGAKCCKYFVQKLDIPNSRTFIGAGKLKEVKNYVTENEIDTLIFDDELTPSQLKNLEKEVGRKIIDRTHLILDIFAQRAKSSSARTQVKLAQYEYMLPRLSKMWTHLERQKGGIGFRGPGETEIETDRRIIRHQISLLREKLKTIDRQIQSQRNNRGKLVRVSLVGYTNVGKSTLMNQLANSNIFAENKLFATLDTTVRKVVIGNLSFLLTDTVGFIRKLPTQLIKSFKSTLDEIRYADLLIHVIDISHPNFEDQMQSVNQTLKEIGCNKKPIIMVFNKIDMFKFSLNRENDLILNKKTNFSLVSWKKMWINKSNIPSVFVSIIEKSNYEEFKKLLYKEVKSIHSRRFPYNDFLFEYYDEKN